MRSFIGIRVNIMKFRTVKIVIAREEIQEIVDGKPTQKIEKESPEVTTLKNKVEMLEFKVSSQDNRML